MDYRPEACRGIEAVPDSIEFDWRIIMPFRTLMVCDYENEKFSYTTKITEEDVFFIVNDADRLIIIWNGQKASMVKKYKGGTLATKIKSLYQLYGFRSQTVNQGEEVGSFKTEVEHLLAGQGTPYVEEPHAPPKATPAITERVSRTAPAITPAATPTPRYVPKEAPAAESMKDKRVIELEVELENEKKKSTHKLTKFKEEMDALKEKLEKQVVELQAELDSSRRGMIPAEKYELEIKQLKGEKDSLNVLVEGLKKELDQKESKDSADVSAKIDSLNREIEELKAENAKLKNFKADKESLEKKNADLSVTITSLQSENTVLKEKVEKAGDLSASTKVEPLQKELEEAKAKIKSMEKELQTVKKSAATSAAEHDEKLKKIETEAASAKQEFHAAQRKLIEEKAATSKTDESGLDFASLDEIDAKPQGSSGGINLAFVNPYSTGELSGEIDPLTDLKSFLNTVDPAKPLDPELKNLLDVISKKIEDDEEVLGDLQKIKKKVKDKKLEGLIDDTIKKIKEKRI